MPRPPSRPAADSLPIEVESSVVETTNNFDFDFFWAENKSKILTLLAVLAAAALIWSIVQYTAAQKAERAAALFDSAQSKEQLEAVVAQYPGSIVAGNAQLLLADKLRSENQLDGTLEILNQFTREQTRHPLIADGWLSLAATLELKNDLKKATETYASISAKYANTQAAPAALSAQARLAKKSGDVKKARSLYENLVQRFPASMWSQDAQQQIDRLPKQ